jgi:hypothetical protein
LFLLQVIVGFLAGVTVLITGSRLAAAAGVVFALATLGGYLLSVWAGLFGFTEVRTTAGIRDSSWLARGSHGPGPGDLRPRA